MDSSLTQLSGLGGKLKVGKVKGLWKYSTEVNWGTPGLDLNDLGYMQTADFISQENNISYFVNKPVSIFRIYRIGFEQSNNWDNNGVYLSSGAELNMYAEFLNKWGVANNLEYTGTKLNTHILRGGRAMYVPALWEEEFVIRTDYSKRVSAELEFDADFSEHNYYRSYGISPGISVRPADKLRLSVYADYSVNRNDMQYVTTKESSAGKNYILATIDQETLGLTFRCDYNITPELSIQYYGSPFATVGSYSDFKTVTNPTAGDYYQRYATINPIADDNGEKLSVDNNSDGVYEYTFDNPDFNFNQFRSNLVFRWEYRPGSQVYLVWSNERTDWLNPGNAPLRNAATRLSDISANNVFMVKFNYWFSI